MGGFQVGKKVKVEVIGEIICIKKDMDNSICYDIIDNQKGMYKFDVQCFAIKPEQMKEV